tara:strand:- start:47 stop:253 length:207 start_codon:yes stop_codon:yes gene_type:complete
MVFIWRIGGYGMSIGRLRQITYIGMIVLTMGFWWSVFKFGFFITLFYVLSISFTIGIYLNYLENRKDK